MLNVNQLTEQLRMMPDQALQRMAQMYKNDPYILPMLISEDTARKKLRQAAQAQAMQPQPKVVDQAVAAMGTPPTPPQPAPGIAALPAPNVANMSDGGIAGYAEGGVSDTAEDAFSRGGMFDFTQRSEPVVRMADGGVPGYKGGGDAEGRSIYDLDRDPLIQKLRGIVPDDELARMDRAELVDTVQKLVAAGKDVATYPGRAAAGVAEQFITRPLRAMGLPVPYLPQSFYGGDRSSATPYMDKLVAEQTAQRTPTGGARSAGIGGPQAGEREAYAAMMAGAPQPGVPGAAPGAAASAPPPRAPGAGTGAPAAPADGGIYSLAGRLFDPIEERTTAQLNRMRMTAQQRGEAERKAFEEGKPKGKVGEGLEALLKKEAEGEAGERENAKALAIFNAGLAMMAGGSPRALENIAKGAMVGTGQYAEAMKDFKKAAKERQKMLANIEEARRAEARDDNKTALSLLQRANDNENKMEMFALDATTTLGFKKADLTGRLYGTQMEQEGAMARVRAQDPLALYRALDPTGKGNIAKGFEAAQSAKREPMTKQALFLEYMKNPLNDPAKFGEYVQQYERQFGPIGSSSGSASQSADEALVKKYLNPPR